MPLLAAYPPSLPAIKAWTLQSVLYLPLYKMRNSPYIEVIPFPLCGFGFLRRLGVQFGSCSNGLFFFCCTFCELEIRSEDCWGWSWGIWCWYLIGDTVILNFWFFHDGYVLVFYTVISGPWNAFTSNFLWYYFLKNFF